MTIKIRFTNKLPSWETVHGKLVNGKELNPIERFILDYEPASVDLDKYADETWRDYLEDALNYYLFLNRKTRN